MSKIIIVAVLCAAGSGSCYDGTSFHDCGSEYDLKGVYIDGCVDREHCHLKIGSSVNITVDMVADFKSESMKQKIYMVIKSIKNELTSTPGPCEGSRLCPVYSDASFRASLKIPITLPALPATLEWSMTNENKVKVLCFSIAVTLCKNC